MPVKRFDGSRDFLEEGPAGQGSEHVLVRSHWVLCMRPIALVEVVHVRDRVEHVDRVIGVAIRIRITLRIGAFSVLEICIVISLDKQKRSARIRTKSVMLGFHSLSICFWSWNVSFSTHLRHNE